MKPQTEIERTCRRCGITQSIEHFPTTNKYWRKDGSEIAWRRHTCRTCYRKGLTVTNWNKNVACAMSQAIICDMTGDDPLTRRELRDLEAIFRRHWYTEFEPNNIPYVYSDSDYLWMTYLCYLDVSFGTTRSIVDWLRATGKFDQPILDVYGGCGLTTAHLATEFPNTQIIYHNDPGKQALAAIQLFERLGLKNVQATHLQEGVNAHTVIAMEVFEHFKEPLPIFDKFIGNNTKLYFDASSFSYEAVGHFNQYVHNGITYDRKKFRRVMTKHLREMGFENAHPVFGTQPFWQQRPSVYWREE